MSNEAGEATGCAEKLRIFFTAFAPKMLAMGEAKSLLADIVHQRCPRCRSGKIFRGSAFLGFPKMNERCPACQLRFEREAGYFLGAMYISYGLALVIITVLATVLWSITRWWITDDVIWAVVLFLPLAPAITYFSRVLWIYFDQTMDPDRS
jgi:uncharacterized protein (DUF983 family)